MARHANLYVHTNYYKINVVMKYKVEKIVVDFMKEKMPFTYKLNNDGRLMTDLANFYDWLKVKEKLPEHDNGDTLILIKGLQDISKWDEEQEDLYDDPGHCASETLIKYYNSKK